MTRLIAALAMWALLAGVCEASRVVILSEAGTRVVWDGVHLGETNGSGFLIIDDVPQGSFEVELSKPGFHSERVGLVIDKAEHTIEKRLRPIAAKPAPRPEVVETKVEPAPPKAREVPPPARAEPAPAPVVKEPPRPPVAERTEPTPPASPPNEPEVAPQESAPAPLPPPAAESAESTVAIEPGEAAVPTATRAPPEIEPAAPESASRGTRSDGQETGSESSASLLPWIALLAAAVTGVAWASRRRSATSRKRRRRRRRSHRGHLMTAPSADAASAEEVLAELQERENAMKGSVQPEIVEAEVVEILEES